MPVVDIGLNEVLLKVVYHGPGLSGRTTNLHYVWVRTHPEEDQTKFFVAVRRAAGVVTFDFVPSSLAPLHRRQVRVSLAASTSSIDDGSRHRVLSGADGVVFVADAQQERSEANEGSMQALARSLAAYGQKLEETPLVLQYNKCDLPNRMALADLQRLLNPRCVPHFEATARTGHGVFDSLKSVVGQILARERARGGAPYR
ncbi:MAG: GTPase domain-containing protein [Labilithrix sp.]